MKKKFIRTIAMFASIATFAVFSACGDDNSTSPASGDNQQVSSSSIENENESSSSVVKESISSSSQKIEEQAKSSSSMKGEESSSSNTATESSSSENDKSSSNENVESSSSIAESSNSEESSSSVEESSSSQVITMIADIKPSGYYSCNDYYCVTKKNLNQEMLEAGKYEEYLDTRDNRVYKVIKIGEQIWMAQNMIYISTEDTLNTACRHSSEEQFYDPFCLFLGRFYTKSVADTICPKGWHLPTMEDAQALKDRIGNTVSQYTALRSATWIDSETGAGTDSLGFAAIRTGDWNGIMASGLRADIFSSSGANYWIAGDGNYYINVERYGPRITQSNSSNQVGFSVRCVAN